MLPKRSVRWARHTQSSGQFSLKSIRYGSSLFFRMTCAVILFCLFAGVGLAARGAAGLGHAQATVKSVDCGTITATSMKSPLPDNLDNIENDTKAALANEWIKRTDHGTDHALRALEILTNSSADPKLTLEVFAELKAGDSSNAALYRAALGDPGNDGHPRLQGLPDFLDSLAKANKLNKKKPDDAEQLFGCTATLIEEIYRNTPTNPANASTIKDNKQEQELEEVSGPVGLARIHDSFSRKDKYVALLQLLKAYPNRDADYPEKLQLLRAAFEMDTDRLAKQIADKITGSKK